MRKKWTKPNKDEISDNFKELVNKLSLATFEPDEDFQELYKMCLNEEEFYHNGFHYSIFLANNSLKNGFDICCQDLNNPDTAYLEGWEDQIPYENFPTRMDLISKFKLKNDGRTLLEYWCDYFHKPRLLVPPVPADYPNI